MTTGHITDIHRSSTIDGPGTRTAVLFKGCSEACPWCDTPESHTTETEIRFIPGRCVGCNSCLEVCPQARQTTADGTSELGSAFCTRCGQCVEVCESGARLRIGKDVTVEELISDLEKDRTIYDESGGGVTFTGGEPLLQPEFLTECLDSCRALRIHTSVHTHGFVPRESLLGVAAKTDLVVFELKLADDRRHRKLTGVPVAPILENLVALSDAGASIWIRVPLLPGINDDAQNLDAIADLTNGLKGVERTHLLQYARFDSRQIEDQPHPQPIEPNL